MTPEKFLLLAKNTSLLSNKINTKVGAILVGINNEIILMASNGYIYPLNSNINMEAESDRHFYSEHAERHLIFSAVRSGICNFHDKTLVVTHFPCCDCARAIILVGIKKIITSTKITGEGFLDKWGSNIAVSKRMLEYNNVSITYE
jgi:dCMP deaminase